MPAPPGGEPCPSPTPGAGFPAPPSQRLRERGRLHVPTAWQSCRSVTAHGLREVGCFGLEPVGEPQLTGVHVFRTEHRGRPRRATVSPEAWSPPPCGLGASAARHLCLPRADATSHQHEPACVYESRQGDWPWPPEGAKARLEPCPPSRPPQMWPQWFPLGQVPVTDMWPNDS